MLKTAPSFGGSIPGYYDQIMGAAHFDSYGRDLAERLPKMPRGDVLEVACGTGIVTRHLRARLDPSLRLVATDISEEMLAFARNKVGGSIDWRLADACALPFAQLTFGALVCAFGVMFFPDKKAAFGEARRVLREGGTMLFSVWDGLDANPHARVVAEFLESLFPGDPAMRFGYIPYQFNDERLIKELLAEAGFGDLRFERVRRKCECPSAAVWATGHVRGTPRGILLQERGISLDDVIKQLAAAGASLGGVEPFRYSTQALVVEARAA
jgi:ubiquinone/menaquinone biosynthesis C-methylase UbiE